MSTITHPCSSQNNLCPISSSPCPGVCVYSSILQGIPLGLILLDTQVSSILFINDETKSLLKLLDKPLDYTTILSLFDINLLENSIGEDITRRDKITIETTTLGYTLYQFNYRFIWVNIKDITNEELLTSIAESVTTMNNIGYITSGIRHELGNPINSIKMTLSVLKQKIETTTCSPEEALIYINRSLDQITRVEYLLKSLKTLNMYESPEIETIEAQPFIQRFIDLVSHDFTTNGIEISTKLPPQPIYFQADPRIIQQVLLNLLTNAADAFTHTKTPTIHILVSANIQRCTILISDNGCGMTSEQLEKVFLPFVTTKSHGTGLGLVLVKKMLTYMNGTIEMQSTPDKGTSVTITLPCEPQC